MLAAIIKSPSGLAPEQDLAGLDDRFKAALANCERHDLVTAHAAFGRWRKTPWERRAELIQEYDDHLANPYIAAERGYIDAVIAPHETRQEIVRSLRLLRSKRETLPAKKHGNIPL